MKTKYSTLIVDDETLARKDLKAILSFFQQIIIKGEVESLEKAKEFVERNELDLIFLDIQLGKENGFDLLKHIPSNIKIIFVTAYDEYAIRAFEINAQDYLLKPVNKERLSIALEHLEEISEHSVSQKKLNIGDSIFAKMDNRYEFFNIDNILFISASDDYTEVHTLKGEKKLVLKSLKEWGNRLPEKTFCRIHRSTIINISMIKKIEPWFNYSFRVYLIDIEKPLIMSRRYFLEIKKKLS